MLILAREEVVRRYWYVGRAQGITTAVSREGGPIEDAILRESRAVVIDCDHPDYEEKRWKPSKGIRSRAVQPFSMRPELRSAASAGIDILLCLRM